MSPFPEKETDSSGKRMGPHTHIQRLEPRDGVTWIHRVSLAEALKLQKFLPWTID